MKPELVLGENEQNWYSKKKKNGTLAKLINHMNITTITTKYIVHSIKCEKKAALLSPIKNMIRKYNK